MLELLKKHIVNIPGKRLKKKLLVFESDDWGSLRIPDVKAFDAMVADGLISPKDPFSKYDALETRDDLQRLFTVLKKYKDKNGNNPVFTANMVMANPDFDKIRASQFKEYHFENFTTTYERYSKSTFDELQKGIAEGLFYTQFHAREHLNVSLWMKLLQQNDISFRKAFDFGCFAIPYVSKDNRRSNLMASYDYTSPNEFEFIKKSIAEGLFIFKTIFKHTSKTTIAPCYVWNKKIEKVFNQQGVNVFQGSRFQQVPVSDSVNFSTVFHYNGQQNNGSVYLMRNCLFEPSIYESNLWVEKCMESIGVAFKWGKPAIIGTHRLNFIGSLVPENREANLKKLDLLLTSILQKWPDVEFVSSPTLAEIYTNERNLPNV